MSKPKSNPAEIANALGIGLIMGVFGYAIIRWAHIIATWATTIIQSN
jgi:putative N-acetylmannosamine-6-phosphate epimerase